MPMKVVSASASSFQTLKSFITLSLGTVRPRRLKLGTHVDNWWMYRVYRNQAVDYLSLYVSFFFLSNFQALISFVTLFSGTVMHRRLKLGTHMGNGWMYHVYLNQAVAYFFLYFLFSFSNFQALKNFVTLFLGTVRLRRLKLGTLVDNGWMYRADWKFS